MRRSKPTKPFWCGECARLKAVGCAGGEPSYYCEKLMQVIVKPANTGCSYFEEVKPDAE